MRAMRDIGLAMAGAVLLAWGADAAEFKVAVMNLDAVLKESPDAKAAENLLQKQVEEYEADQKESMGELEKLKKEFDTVRKEAANKALSQEERERKADAADAKLSALRDKDRQMQELRSKRQKDLTEQSMRMRKRVVGKIRGMVKEYAEKKGYSLVLDSSAGAMTGGDVVLYAPEKTDITEDLKKVVAEAGASKPGKDE